MNTTEQKTAGAEEGKKIEKLEPTETNKLQPLSEYREKYYNTLKMDKIDGLYSGFPFIDNNLRGLRQTTVLAGSPKTGKTSFCTQLVTQIAAFNGSHLYPEIPLKNRGNNDYPNIEIKQKQAVLFYSLEMSTSDITTKIISQLSGVNYWEIKLNSKEKLEKISQEKAEGEAFLLDQLALAEEQRMKMNNIFIRDLNDYTDKDGKNTLDFATVRAEIDQVKAATGATELIVFIDHLQVFPIEPSTYKDQIDKEGQVIKEFNKIALEKGVTMFLISQTNKEAMKAAGDLFSDLEKAEKRPNIDEYLSGVKGSVDTVYIASGIWSMVKTGYSGYYERQPAERDGSGNIIKEARPAMEVKLLALIITERNSAGGFFYLLYFPMQQKFEFIVIKELDNRLKELGLSEAEIKEFKQEKKTREKRENNPEGNKKQFDMFVKSLIKAVNSKGE